MRQWAVGSGQWAVLPTAHCPLRCGPIVEELWRGQALRGNLHEERIQPVPAKVGRPDEIAAGDVEIALGPLRIVVSAAACGVQVARREIWRRT